MNNEELRARVMSRVHGDAASDLRMHICGGPLHVAKTQAKVFMDLSTQYAAEVILAEELSAELRKDRRTLLDRLGAVEGQLKEAEELRLKNAQLEADIHAIMCKLQRLQPGGSPPPTGSPVVNAYWIVDHVLNNGFHQEIK